MRRSLLLAAAALVGLGLASARAEAAVVAPSTIRDCILAAANLYREPPGLLLILLNVEGGTLGRVSKNSNGTVDIGPMQVNQIWIAAIAAHWHASERATFRALRDSFCANVEAGAWILRRSLDEAGGRLWGGVAFYHSHTPAYQRRYLLSVLKQAERLEALAKHPAGATATMKRAGG